MHVEESLNIFFKKAKEIYGEHKSTYKYLLDNFFRKARVEYNTYIKIKRELDRYLSTDFNFIDIIAPDELRISYILSLLLDPNGVHGQGSIFLEIFLDKLGKKGISNIFSAEIFREKTTDLLEEGKQNRRIDIYINVDGFVIAIENKPWAGEQEDQMEDYFRYLEKLKNRGGIRDFRLVYLHGTGEKPHSISKETIDNNKDKFKFESYSGLLIPWLKECYRECESQKVRFFIKDFIIWIERNFKESSEEYNG